MSLQFSPITSPSPAPLVPSRQHSLLRKTPPSRATGLPSPRQRASTGYSNGSSKSAPVSPNFRASSAPGLAPLSLISPIALTQELPDSRAPNGKDNYRPGLPRRSSSGNNNYQEAESSRAADARARTAQLEQAQRLQFMAQQQALFQHAQQQQQTNGSFPQKHQSQQNHPQLLSNQQQFRVYPSQPLATRQLPRKSPGANHPASQHSAYPFPNQHRSRSRPRPNPGISSSESEYDSDVTAVPLGKTSANSKSQPDLVAFRKEAAHGWAAQQAAERDKERAKLQQPRVRTPSAGSYPATNGPSPSHFRPSPITIPSNGINRTQQVAAENQGAQNGISPSSRTRPLLHMSPLQSAADLSRSLSPLDTPSSRSARSPQTSASPGSLSRSINALSRSQPSLFSLRDPVPRNAPYSGFTGSSREATTTSLDSSPDIRRRRVAATGSDSGTSGGENDADDDWDATSASSPSSGSLTFSPKRTRHRSKGLEMGALGLVGVDRGSGGDGGITTETETEGENGTLWSRREKLSIQAAQGFNVASAYANQQARPSSLLFFRLLAVVPSWWGVLVLLDGARNQGLWADVWPWGIDLSRDAWNARLGEEGLGVPMTVGWGQDKHRWEKAARGELLIAVLWALLTSQFCFSLTTGLTHRWRSYYSLPSTVTRLMSLQCLCWPATYATLRILGAKRPLLAWVVIGVTTGWSRAVQMFVTSNVVEENTVTTNTAANSTFGSASTTPAGHGHGVPLPSRGRSPIEQSGPPPSGCSDWEAFLWGRKWDWDKVSRKVTGKVAFLFLITAAWLFWVEENGGREKYLQSG